MVEMPVGGIDPLGGVMAAGLLGITLGLTTCTATCLPYVGAWVVGRGAGGRSALGDTLLFALGKVVAYGLLGGLAAALGGWLAGYLAGGAGVAAVAWASCLAGVVLLLPPGWLGGGRCGVSGGRSAAWPPFFLGFALGLVPCAPLLGLLGSCAGAGGVVAGWGYGVAFGLGAVVSPLVVAAPLLGWLGGRVVGERLWLVRWSRAGGGVVLMAMGIPPLLSG